MEFTELDIRNISKAIVATMILKDRVDELYERQNQPTPAPIASKPDDKLRAACGELKSFCNDTWILSRLEKSKECAFIHRIELVLDALSALADAPTGEAIEPLKMKFCNAYRTTKDGIVITHPETVDPMHTILNAELPTFRAWLAKIGGE